jgi:hypothetical protein
MDSKHRVAKFLVPDCGGYSLLWHRVAVSARHATWVAGRYDTCILSFPVSFIYSCQKGGGVGVFKSQILSLVTQTIP